MQPRDAFGVVVRSFGLLILLYTLWGSVMMLNTVGFSLKLILFSIIPTAAIGFWMLNGAALIIDFAYPPEDLSPSPSNEPRETPGDGS